MSKACDRAQHAAMQCAAGGFGVMLIRKCQRHTNEHSMQPCSALLVVALAGLIGWDKRGHHTPVDIS
jgi:hypothetical protein